MSPKRIELVVSLIIVLLLIWVLWEARGWPPHSRLFPWLIGFSVLVLAVIQLGSSIWNILTADSMLHEVAEAFPPTHSAATEEGGVAFMTTDKDSPQLDHQPEVIAELEIVHRRVIGICAWIIVFFLGIWLLGFKITSLLLTFAFLKFSANERWAISVTLSVANYLFFLIVFDYALRVPLSSGLLLESFAPGFEIGRILRALTGG